MAVRGLTCAFVVLLVGTALAVAQDFDNAGLKIALKVFEECSRTDGLSPCLKRKAISFLDRLGRAEKFQISDEITVVQDPAAENVSSPVPTEEQIEQTLPRDLSARDDILSNLLWNKLSSVVRSKNIEFNLPTLSTIGEEEGRGKGPFDLKKVQKITKKSGGLITGLLLGIVGKLVSLIPIGIAGLFLLAGKALITSKIALLISGIIALKKLIAAKHSHGGGHQVWASGGGGGGWDKRSFDESQKLAYNSYAPQ